MGNGRPSGRFRPRRIGRLLARARRARRPLVVLAPHPDDETLGCGLLMARAARAGVRLAVVLLTDGGASHPGSRRFPPRALARLRAGELRRALARLGCGGCRVVPMNWPDGGLGPHGRAPALRRALARLAPAAVLAPSPRDHHADHQAGWRLARRAAPPNTPLVAYEVWARAGAPPRRARDPHLAAKAWALAAHRSQLGLVVDDAPDGFALDAATLRALVRGEERFHAPAQGGERFHAPARGGERAHAPARPPIDRPVRTP